ncbi:MAG: helix-turn-helix domain-containing protein [Clostridia bacterium]|nr:helix-turn-helix domain-containing protein [Clostridia bacterium]
MKYSRYPKRDAIRNYFPLPNEIFSLGLCAGEISVYSYLLYREDRKTYQCHPSYKTIGRAIDASKNTVRKYVTALESKGLITTEPTNIRTKDGRKHNGSLLYTIRPIQEAINLFNERQLAQLKADAAKQCAAKKLEEYNRRHPQEPLCEALESVTSPSPPEDGLSGIEAASDEERRTKGKAG